MNMIMTELSASSIHSNPWFSSNPDKAWAEKFFLIFSPLWMMVLGAAMFSGVLMSIGDIGFLFIALSVALPFIIVPAIIQPHLAYGLRWYQSYWFKANLYIFSFSFFGNYFGSEYFFDVLGMVYNYPSITWNFDSEIVGEGKRIVPIIMYVLTQAYFMTYHTTATVVLRRIRHSGITIGPVSWMFLVFAIGYCWAWLETKAMANPMIASQFYYENIPAMLKYGSMFYALYFIASFPVFYEIDEDQSARWDVKKTFIYSLAVSMIVFYLLDLSTKLIAFSN